MTLTRQAWKVEVLDEGGTGVGTSVKVCASAEEAIRWLAVTLREPWAGAWSLSGPGISLSGNERSTAP